MAAKETEAVARVLFEWMTDGHHFTSRIAARNYQICDLALFVNLQELVERFHISLEAAQQLQNDAIKEANEQYDAGDYAYLDEEDE